MRLNWFSPLPPAKTDIAEYTARLLPALRARADVQLWTDQTSWEADLQRRCCVRRFDPGKVAWPDLQKADLNIYNIGNNSDFHSGIWLLSQQMPGIVILHDTCLQHLFGGYYLHVRKDRDAYVAQMTRHHGEAGRRIAESFAAGACSTESLAVGFPFTALALERALGVVVHTRPAFELVASMTHRPLVYAPLPYQPSGDHARRGWDDLRRRRPRPPYKVVVLGYLGPNRRLDSILRALRELPERSEFRLAIYGTIWDPEYIRRLIHSYALDSLVECYGYVEDLDNVLADGDLALNLRHPTMGEASGTQLRLWDHAIPTMVTKTGWYATLHGDAVRFVRPECEVTDIIAGLQSYLRDPAGASRLGETGRHILDTEHTPEQYAASLAALVPLALCEYPRTAALSLADRVGRELKRWAPVYAHTARLEHFAEMITSLPLGTKRSAYK